MSGLSSCVMIVLLVPAPSCDAFTCQFPSVSAADLAWIVVYTRALHQRSESTFFLSERDSSACLGLHGPKFHEEQHIAMLG